MNRISVDQSGFESIRLLYVEPKVKYQDGQPTSQQDMDENNVPLFNVVCLAKMPTGGKPETITVKVPMTAAPNIEEYSKVAFAGLTAFAYVAGNRAQFSFSADKMGKARE